MAAILDAILDFSNIAQCWQRVSKWFWEADIYGQDIGQKIKTINLNARFSPNSPIFCRTSRSFPEYNAYLVSHLWYFVHDRFCLYRYNLSWATCPISRTGATYDVYDLWWNHWIIINNLHDSILIVFPTKPYYVTCDWSWPIFVCTFPQQRLQVCP